VPALIALHYFTEIIFVTEGESGFTFGRLMISKDVRHFTTATITTNVLGYLHYGYSINKF
jgi:hypothetical protein